MHFSGQVMRLIKQHQSQFNKLQVVLDAFVIVAAYLLSWYLRLYSGLFESEGEFLGPEVYLAALAMIVPGYLILYYFFRLYTRKRLQGRREELKNIVQANVIGVLLIITILFIGKESLTHFSRMMIFIFFVLNVIFEEMSRILIRQMLYRMRKQGFNQKHILLVGYSRAAEEFIDRVRSNPHWGYIVRGILDDNVEGGLVYRGVKVLGRIDNLPVILPENKLDEIAITLSIGEYSRLEEIVMLCEKSGVHTKFIPDYNRIIPTKPYTEDLQGLPVINIRHVPLSTGFNKGVKRVVDFIGASFAIVLFSPIMLVTALLVKLTSPGPVIFSQERVGRQNKTFKMYKFRSMEVQKPKEEEKAWTKRNDPRVTGIGKVIRRTSIDELPQLLNVLKGDMSLIGPRPERPYYVEKFKEEIPRYMVKHQVRPGITGWAQVNGFRGDTSIRGRIDCDLYYIENWTLGLDIKILFMTVFKGFINKNAY